MRSLGHRSFGFCSAFGLKKPKGTYVPAPTPSPTPSSDISPATLVVLSPDNEYPPRLLARFLDDTVNLASNPHLVLQYSIDPAVVTGVATLDIPITNVSEMELPALDALVAGTHRFKNHIEIAGVRVSDDSPIVTHGPDDFAPQLQDTVGTKSGTTSGVVGVTTDTGEGTIYFVLTLNNVAPSKAQVKAGQNSAGASAKSAVISPNSPGAKNVAVTGLSQATLYYVWAMHEDATSNQSNVLGGASFTTDTAPAFGMSEVYAPAVVVSPGGTDYTFTGASLGAADSTREFYVLVDYDNSGGALAGLRFDASNATVVKALGVVGEGPGYLYHIAFPAGTSADITVRTASPFNKLFIKVWRVVGGGTATPIFADPNYNDEPYGIGIDPPVGGGVILFAGQGTVRNHADTGTGTPSWSNATPGSTTQGGGRTVLSASNITPGSVTAAYTGFKPYSQDYWLGVSIPAA